MTQVTYKNDFPHDKKMSNFMKFSFGIIFFASLVKHFLNDKDFIFQ